MTSDPAAVRVRFSASQMSVIWPGLDRIVVAYSGYCKTGQSLYAYRSWMFNPSAEFNRGRYNNDCMNQIVGLWKLLRPKANRGGRAHLNAIEIRAAILAVRVNSDWWRLRKHELRKHKARTKQMLGVDAESLQKLEKRASLTIRSLERHLKRANYRLLAQVERGSYDALMSAWREHVRWIRLHLVYFRPQRPIIRRSKTQYQLILDQLEEMARVAIAEEGYQLPSDTELRRVMRLFTFSSRRGRRGYFDIICMLRNTRSEIAKSKLAEFILERLDLKPLAEKR